MIKDGSQRMKCSMCGKSFFRDETQCPPFCSKRCQQVDMRNWMTEAYGMPLDGHEDQLPDFEDSMDHDEGSDSGSQR